MACCDKHAAEILKNGAKVIYAMTDVCAHCQFESGHSPVCPNYKHLTFEELEAKIDKILEPMKATMTTSAGSTKEVSDCCKAPVRSEHGCDADFGHGGKKCDCEIVTAWSVCTKCQEPCDIVSRTKETALPPIPTKRWWKKVEWPEVIYRLWQVWMFVAAAAWLYVFYEPNRIQVDELAALRARSLTCSVKVGRYGTVVDARLFSEEVARRIMSDCLDKD